MRVEFKHGDTDGNFRIARNIFETIKGGLRGMVETAAIEKQYEEFDDSGHLIPQTIDEKCAAIANELKNDFSCDAQYRVEGDRVYFTKAEAK